MNTYLLPICYPDILPEIITVTARTYNDAQEKFMHKVCSYLKEDDYFDWKEFKDAMCEKDCLIGEIYDKDQF